MKVVSAKMVEKTEKAIKTPTFKLNQQTDKISTLESVLVGFSTLDRVVREAVIGSHALDNSATEAKKLSVFSFPTK